jgi:acetyl-CoA C-acetyltransferase
MSGCIVGWAHGKFGKREGLDLEALIAEVAVQALADANVAPAEVDEIYVGHFGGGFVKQDFPASLVFQAAEALRFKPSTRVENACATGSAAVHLGLMSLAARKSRVVLVVGVEKMTETPGEKIGEILMKASYVKEEDRPGMSFAGVFGQIAQLYAQRYGDPSEAMARIAAKNHRNGIDNPWAQLRKDLGFEFCRTISERNPLVAGPLRRTDCSLVSDGAAALVLADVGTSLRLRKAVAFRARAHVNDYLPMSRRDIVAFEGCAQAWRMAHRDAGTRVDDLRAVETHDCFTIAELLQYEAMGLAAPGQGGRVALDGVTEKDGRLPVNPSGGLKSKGHPIGATGVSMHVMAAMQATGSAGAMQVRNPGLTGVFNMGGAAVANYVSILEPLRA